MSELIRDTPFGHIVRLVTRNRYLQYAEEKDPSLWQKYVDEKKSGNVAHHGTTEDPEDGEKLEGLGGIRTRDGQDVSQIQRNSSGSERTALDPEATYNNASGVRVDPEKGKDVLIVSWFGDDDPENPMNWSLGKKVFVSFEICLLTTSIYIGSSIYTAGNETVEKTFGVSEVAATLGLTCFVAGYGLGPMLWAPMSEIPFIGRNPVYLSTLFVFVMFQIPTALASNFGMLLAFRFLTGFFGSPVLATGGASISDMYIPRKRAYAISIWGISAVCGPTLGPLVGGFAAQAKGWTWTIWELMWLSGFCWVFLMFFMPETSATNILYRRTARLRKLTGNDKLKCEPELAAEEMTRMSDKSPLPDVLLLTLNSQGSRNDVARSPLYAQLHRTHGLPPQSLHRSSLRPSLRLV